MSRKPFYLSRRGNIWYARIIDPKTGNELSAISTDQTDRDLAVMIVSRWLVEGIPKTNSKPKRLLQVAFSVSRLFDIVEEIDLTSQEAERILTILKQRGLLEKIKMAEEKDFITYLLDFYNFDTKQALSVK